MCNIVDYLHHLHNNGKNSTCSICEVHDDTVLVHLKDKILTIGNLKSVL